MWLLAAVPPWCYQLLGLHTRGLFSLARAVLPLATFWILTAAVCLAGSCVRATELKRSRIQLLTLHTRVTFMTVLTHSCAACRV